MNALAGRQQQGGQQAGLVAHVVALPRSVPPILAVGPFLKNTLCLAHGINALISRDVGSLETPEAVLAFEDSAAQLLKRLNQAPVAVAHDLHPDFYSTRYAEALAEHLGIEAVPVQHHHAHVAAVMAEHGRDAPTLGLALDGFGLGADSESWGGELLLVEAEGYRRLGHLVPLAQPGGDRAAREPWRMAAAALDAMGRGGEIPQRFPAFKGAAVVAQMLAKNVNTPKTSSAGRLFDAACGLLGVKPIAGFEGEAPMELERLASLAPLGLEIDSEGWKLCDGVLDMLPLLTRLANLGATREAERGAALFHGTLAAALACWVGWAAETTGVRHVVLGGGCFFNRILTQLLCRSLEQQKIRPLQPIGLGPGDAAVSLGQAWVAAMARR
jgi:hydrogenase maturation protein HypF